MDLILTLIQTQTEWLGLTLTLTRIKVQTEFMEKINSTKDKGKWEMHPQQVIDTAPENAGP